MGSIRSLCDLIVWQKSMDAAMQIFEMTKSWPAAERCLLIDQILRSSRSVPSNIAEAWRKRRYPAAWVSRLNDAEGEAAETQTDLDVAIRSRYLDEATHARLDGAYEEVLSMLVDMNSHPDHWKIR